MGVDVIGSNPNVLRVLAAVFVVLAAGSALRILRSRGRGDEGSKQKLQSLRTWWILTVVFTAALLLGGLGIAVFFAAASALGLREYLALVLPGPKRRGLIVWAYLTIPVQYVWIYFAWTEVFLTFIPVGVLLLLATRAVLSGVTTHYVRDIAALQWGIMLIVFFLSHAAALPLLAGDSSSPAGAAGWALYLVLLSQANDIAQSLFGRFFGKRKITPRVSPHKTWEGFLGGVATTVALAAVLAAPLTPLAEVSPRGLPAEAIGFPYAWAVVAGLIIAISGFLGDINMSALKRDFGVKDSGTLLPGQGGVLDRIDSLTFSAPCFFYFVKLLDP